MSATIRQAQARNNTGICGITETVYRDARWDITHRYFVVTPKRRRFNIDTLGRPEAFRRALRLRAEHEQAVLNRSGKEAARG